MKKLSLSKKIIIGFLLSGILPVLIISIIVFKGNSQALREEARNKLIAVREAKAFQIEELYGTMFSQISAMAQNSLTISAIQDFDTAFKKYQNEVTLPKNHKENLESYYTDQFGVTYADSNIGMKFDHLGSTLKKLDNTATALQYSFISKNKFPLGEKDKLTDLGNKTTYSKMHSKYHNTFRTYLNKFGFYDIFLVSAKTGNIVYSVFKELDFATSVSTGPYTNTGIGEAFKLGIGAKNKNDTFITDMAKYFPSYEAPAQFLSAPIYNKGTLLGTLIFQVPVSKVDDITTGKQNWIEHGQGASGETYIVSNDLSMRSLSRFIAEDEKGFFEIMNKLGVKQDDINYMKSKKTSVLGTKVDTKGARSVTAGNTNFEVFDDYRGVSVLSAYRPVKVKGLNWGILSEMDEDEALGSVSYLKKIVIILIVVASVIILFSSLFFSKSIVNQLVSLAELLKKGADTLLSTAENIAESSALLSEATVEQASSLQESSSSINEISAMVSRSSDTATGTAELAEKSTKIAQNGKNSVNNVKSKIDDIHKNNDELVKSVDENNHDISNINTIIQEISDKTKIINDIVFQTKLLSFNASVEAARAGEHGKGFSVVAEEIGALAEMSGTAATEIAELLDRSTNQVSRTVENSKVKMKRIIDEGKGKLEEGKKEIENCDSILGEILTSFNEVNTSISEIAQSSNEQATGVKDVTQGIQQLNIVTQQNTSISTASLKNADTLKSQSSDLIEMVDSIQAIVFGEGHEG